jgi:hypothetical protein
MPGPWRGPSNVLPFCPDCERDLTFVASWTFRDLWGYREVRTYECASHGPVFITSERAVGVTSARSPDIFRDDGDRDSLIPARRKPTPTLNVDAITLPEPD